MRVTGGGGREKIAKEGGCKGKRMMTTPFRHMRLEWLKFLHIWMESHRAEILHVIVYNAVQSVLSFLNVCE